MSLSSVQFAMLIGVDLIPFIFGWSCWWDFVGITPVLEHFEFERLFHSLYWEGFTHYCFRWPFLPFISSSMTINNEYIGILDHLMIFPWFSQFYLLHSFYESVPIFFNYVFSSSLILWFSWLRMELKHSSKQKFQK